MPHFTTRLTGHITPEDKARNDYAYIDFDLPFAASSLAVHFTYSAQMSSDEIEGGNVIDLGLFDPRGSAFPGGAGFRGWSGSARDEFRIGRLRATPGYLPGPLPAGRYQIVLGLYRIWAEGADYTIDIEADKLTPDDELVVIGTDNSGVAEAASSGAVLNAAAEHSERRWLRGDLQSHTFHSDAKGSPEQLVAKARALGLDFLAVTDHNTVSTHPFLAQLAGPDLILIAGQEATTYHGHMNIWGTSRWCDFRARNDADMRAIIDLAHAHGATCSINHPKKGGPAWEFDLHLPADTLEVWQGPWPNRNDESLALWDRLLNAGRRLPAVGGSDYHCPASAETNLLRLGQPTTWALVQEQTAAAILEALRAGRVCISAHPRAPRLSVAAQSSRGHAAMGEVLPIAPGEALELTVTVVQGETVQGETVQGETVQRETVHGDDVQATAYRLRVIADGAIAEEVVAASGQTNFAFTVVATRYVRCELVADVMPAQLPPATPAGLDLRDWRWALSNPVYVTA